MNKKVRIVGVPEHFNLPWHMAMDEGAFSARGIDLVWTDVPEGTGKMAMMLRNNQADLAVILTEGIIKAVSEGTPALIAQEYIASPLLWGIHVDANSPYGHESELIGKVAAISRYGSGSHLMAFVHARQQGWPLEQLRFKVVDTLEGAIDALSSEKADYFMWERFTTQPLIDKGAFRRIGICPTPWPCFVIAVRDAFAKKNSGILSDILETINVFTREFRQIPSIDRTLARHYHLEEAAVREWLTLTRWSQHQIDLQTIEKTSDTLIELKLINKRLQAKSLLWNP